MYKKQMKCQKAVCLLCMISSVIVFLYALGIMTDLYDSLYSTMMNPADLTQTTVPGSIVYYNMQEFNSVFLKYSIGLILLACLLYITNTHIRRKYYIGNYIAAALFVIANVNIAIWAHQYIEVFKAQFLNVDFEALKKHAELWKTTYTESTFWFDIHSRILESQPHEGRAEAHRGRKEGSMNDEKTIQLDRMRFTKNTTSANLALLAILFNVLFFISIYESDKGSWYYTILVGASILYNLIFLLAAFLASEGVKNYNIRYAYLLFILGAGQLIRIFIYPMKAHDATVKIKDQAVQVMGDGQFMRVVLYLVLSAACCFAAGVVGASKSKALSAHLASMSEQTK